MEIAVSNFLKLLLWPITTDTNSAMNQSEFRANTCNGRQARENACERGRLALVFVSHWLMTWREVANQSVNVVKENVSRLRHSNATGLVANIVVNKV